MHTASEHPACAFYNGAGFFNKKIRMCAMRNIKIFLLLGTNLSFITPNTFAAECAVTDCSLLGYTDNACPGNGLKCPFGEGWYCGGTAAEDCIKLGYNQDCSNPGESGSGETCNGKYQSCTCDSIYQYTCSGTGYSGGSGTACNGKYTACTCANGYAWNGSSCAATCNYSYTAAYCAQSCKNTSGSPCYKGNTAYYAGCGSSKCKSNQACISGTCKTTSTYTLRCCSTSCFNYSTCVAAGEQSCSSQQSWCENTMRGSFSTGGTATCDGPKYVVGGYETMEATCTVYY